MIRTFIALPLPETVKDALFEVSGMLRKTINARWVKPDAIHLTMKFLGDIDEKNLVSIGERLDDVSSRHPRFVMRLTGLGAFPSVRKARLIWAGIDTDMVGLHKLAASIDDLSANYGVPKEGRPFTAHITLARLREPSMINLDVRMRDITFIIDKMHLYKSDLTPQGARYTLLHSSPFTGKPGG
jgi:RNA 2',3'-cyclic 3'-phosphodiesterase